jgi:chromosome segregation protein
LADLRRELKWARIEKKMSALGKIEARIEQRKRALELCESKITENLGASKKREEGFNELKNRRARLVTQIVALTKEEARLEADLEWCEKLSKPNIGQESSGGIMREIQGSERQEELLELAGRASQHLERVRKKLSLATEELAHLEDLLERELARLVEAKVELGVNTFRKEMILEELHSLETERRIEKDELKLGPRFENPRKIMEILIEMSAIEEQLKPLAQLSEDVEKTFGSYAELFEDLKSKAEQVARNRHEIIVELDKRMRRWRDVLEGFLEELSERYNAILSKVGATGSVRLTGTHDITAAGLEILAGFRGGKPTSLDSLTQSGGERSVALMAFLLALQQNIASPFRAIDEFDVHMDPKNREVVSQLIVSIAKELGSQQYIVITPGQITVEEKDVHVLVVQNVDGSSVVSEVT